MLGLQLEPCLELWFVQWLWIVYLLVGFWLRSNHFIYYKYAPSNSASRVSETQYSWWHDDQFCKRFGEIPLSMGSNPRSPSIIRLWVAENIIWWEQCKFPFHLKWHAWKCARLEIVWSQAFILNCVSHISCSWFCGTVEFRLYCGGFDILSSQWIHSDKIWPKAMKYQPTMGRMSTSVLCWFGLVGSLWHVTGVSITWVVHILVWNFKCRRWNRVPVRRGSHFLGGVQSGECMGTVLRPRYFAQ